MLAVALSVGAGCRKPAPRPDAPRPRIVSYSPALTETLVYAGLAQHVVGIESHAPVPPGIKPAIVGDALKPNAEAIIAAQPDLLLIQSQPQQFAAVRGMNPNIRIEHFRIETIQDVAAAIERVGDLAQKPQQGIDARSRFEARISALAARACAVRPMKVAFVMDHRNPFTGGAGTFLNEVIALAGGENVFADLPGWQAVNAELILKRSPEVLICQSSLTDAPEARKYWARLTDMPAVRAGKVHVVTESGWTVPSPAVADYIERLIDLIHGPAPATTEASP
jgi:iron complex transport system substrate-binding protein